MYLELKSGGFVCLYYDNIMCFGNPREVEILAKRWTEPGGSFDCFGVTLKEHSLWTLEQWSNLKGIGIPYLGVSIERNRGGKRNRKDMFPSWVTHWKQLEEKLPNWIQHTKDMLSGDYTTYRRVAQLTGRLLWRQSISRTPLCNFSEIIKITKHLMKEKGTHKRTWDSQCQLFEEEKNTLHKESVKMTRNEYIYASSASIYKNPHPCFACSDSSDKAWGYVIYAPRQGWVPEEVLEEEGFSWDNDNNLKSDEHIFLKELIAANRTIFRMIEVFGQNNSLVIGVDNTAAVHAIRNMYSGNNFANIHLTQLFQKLEDSNCSVHVIAL
jgi:hypothetical protein